MRAFLLDRLESLERLEVLERLEFLDFLDFLEQKIKPTAFVRWALGY